MGLSYLAIFFQYIEATAEELETKDGLVSNDAAKIQQFYNVLTSSIEEIRKFCDRIPGINELCRADADLLFQSACLELFALRLAYRYVQNQSTQSLNKGSAVVRSREICHILGNSIAEEEKFIYSIFYIVFSNKSHKTSDDSSDFQLHLWGE
jgi:hypothetical protein